MSSLRLPKIVLSMIAVIAVAILSPCISLPYAYGDNQTVAETNAFQHTKKKIVIFYSSIGAGHISAAKSIEQEIKKEAPQTEVVMKNIRDFMSPAWRNVDEKLFWFIIKNMPETFDNLFHSSQIKGNKISSLAKLPNDYPEQKVLAYLKEQKADAVIATHYGSAQVLGTLKEHGELKNTKVGWVHTDYFTGYFPRISKRIDKTFLAHPELEKQWLESGVSASTVITTGMPVSVPNSESIGDKSFLETKGLKKNLPTITIASGKEGVGDFAEAIKSIARSYDEPVQVIAITGTNTKNFAILKKLIEEKHQANSPIKNVIIKLEGLVKQPELISYVKASDAFITKAGGLSPAESFTIGKPTILMTVIGGHEKENALLFDRLGLAIVNSDIKQIGGQVKTLLSDPEKQAKMLAEQQKFREKLDISKIAQFALDNTPARQVPENFGKEHGAAAQNSIKALEQLEKDSPADIEILLSYSTSTKNEKIAKENPFGHVAIRVKDNVYSTNFVAKAGEDSNYLLGVSLNDYLYGVERPTPNQVHTGSYGMAYGRDTIGLRIKGLTAEQLVKMHAEAEHINKDFATGVCTYGWKSNCGDDVSRILEAAGFDVPKMPGPSKSPYTMPLDMFDRTKNYFTSNPEFSTELVSYNMLAGTKAEYHYSRFPLSISQPIRSISNARASKPDELEDSVTKRVLGYAIDDSVHYENINGKSVARLIDNIQTHEADFNQRELNLSAEKLALMANKKNFNSDEFSKMSMTLEKKEQLYMIERNYDLARITTEHLEYYLPTKEAQKIKKKFNDLMIEYAKISTTSSSQEYKSFYSSLQSYEQSLVIVSNRTNGAGKKLLLSLSNYLRGLWDHLVNKFEDSSKYLAKITNTKIKPAVVQKENCGLLFRDLLYSNLH